MDRADVSRSGSDLQAAAALGQGAAEETAGKTAQERTRDPQEIPNPGTAAPAHLTDRDTESSTHMGDRSGG